MIVHDKWTLQRANNDIREIINRKPWNKEYTKQCFYCERNFNKNFKGSVDHVIPISQGGTNHKDNKVYCCQKCNTLKGAMLPEEFIDYLKININKRRRKMIKNLRYLIDKDLGRYHPEFIAIFKNSIHIYTHKTQFGNIYSSYNYINIPSLI